MIIDARSRQELIQDYKKLYKKHQKTLDNNIRLNAKIQNQKRLINTMAQDIAELQKQLIEIKYKSEGEAND